MKQTAVEWFADKIDDLVNDGLRERLDLLKVEAKEMERKQIVDAVDGFPVAFRHLDGEAYYSEIYTKAQK